jgi:tetratricopeptide (TPR) repeat protein
METRVSRWVCRVTAPRHRAEELLARADSSEPALLAPALSGAGTMCFVSGDFESARAYHRRAQAQYALLGDTAGLAWSAQCLAVQDIATGDLDRAQDAARTALIMARESGHTRTLSSVLSTLAAICCYQRRFAEGEHHSREALEVARTNGDHWATGKALINLAYAVESQGEHARACTHVREALEVSRSIDDHVLATFAVETTAELCVQLGAPRRAAQLLAAAQAHRAEVAQPLPQQDAELLSGVVAATRAMVGEVAFHVAWSQGTELSLDEASRSALDWTASKVG